MERITLRQQEISGWKDHFQAQTYSTLINRSIRSHPQKNHQQKKETISSKTSKHQHSRLLSKYSLNFREIANTTKKYRTHKMGESDLLLDKKTLLQYLQSETSQLQTNTQKMALETIANLNTLKHPFEGYKSLISYNDQAMLCHTSVESPTGNQTFQQIFWKGTAQKRNKNKDCFLNTKFANDKNDLDKKKYRSRQYLNRSYLKKQNMIQLYEQERIVEKIDFNRHKINFNRHKIKQFPLFFREVVEKEQEWSKKREKGKQRFKADEKMCKCEMQFRCLDKDVVLGQFLDNRLFSKNMRI